MGTTFLALYRGPVGSAELLAVTADPSLVADFATRLLRADHDPPDDPILAAKQDGQRRVLRLVAGQGRRMGARTTRQ